VCAHATHSANWVFKNVIFNPNLKHFVKQEDRFGMEGVIKKKTQKLYKDATICVSIKIEN